MKHILLLFIFFPMMACATQEKENGFPTHWWKPVPADELASWEIGPDEAREGEVILSKRNELGVLSNFADTPFEFEGKKYATLEGLWQSMKFPENRNDERFDQANWPYKRSEVEQMQGFDAKKAGSFGSEVMKKMGINYVTYKGKKMTYRTSKKAHHHKIIKAAMIAKMKQNPKVLEVLLSTKHLILRPDHHTSPNDPPAWKYYQIWMDVRADLQN